MGFEIEKKKIFVAGLTAAGKTTHSKLISLEYEMKYVSASSFLLKTASINPDEVPANFWVSPEAAFLEERRVSDKSIDMWVDKRMIEAATQLKNTVFDSWALPWLSTESGIRIWLESSLQSRVWKAIVSHGSTGDANTSNVLEKVKEKDVFSRNYFLSTYGFDIEQDHDVFDFIIDITQFISKPTLAASQISISTCQEIISSLIKAENMGGENRLRIIAKLIDQYGEAVIRKHKIEEN